jgi:hypothetical protein
MMELRHDDLAERLFEIGNNTPPSRLMFPLWGLAKGALLAGYPKDDLIEDFEELRAQFEERGEEEREDAVLEVMDFLYGWGSPHMKL